MIKPNSIVMLLACVSLACVAEDEIDEEDRDALLEEEDEEDESLGDPCSIFDSNGPLPGGTITVNGCDAGERCVPYACGSHSCAGTCEPGEGLGRGALQTSEAEAAGHCVHHCGPSGEDRGCNCYGLTRSECTACCEDVHEESTCQLPE